MRAMPNSMEMISKYFSKGLNCLVGLFTSHESEFQTTLVEMQR